MELLVGGEFAGLHRAAEECSAQTKKSPREAGLLPDGRVTWAV